MELAIDTTCNDHDDHHENKNRPTIEKFDFKDNYK